MALYEHIFIARQDVSQQQVEALTEQFSNIIKEQGGQVGKTEYWGLRNLAFKVKKNRKGHYTLVNIDAPHAAVAEMERQMGISEDVLRFITVRVEEHETEPSAMMQSRGDRGDRGDRRGGDRFGDRDRGDRGDRGSSRFGDRERPRRDDNSDGGQE
ncbi:ribosomal protein S6 [Parvibaculum lavamentivorans DS-1]|uniref:Small ribosomal subunit protein bS6 n=1 Tax=Parvibaculum lavamentivorans (strain DS-1 / DSM 13023 / NCIMB 13966) TaxID=402881 RepID=RS6_PARL1|nr:30S ribosomal protein S6 [Parvibaculum lavamentivorans]A7HYI2.1 RecName: Full=Small ribosomal subunit protein bS6; AltName: Full=30S ribosomal protein S6 [Parvibaculum lavamentivorans DS-1]ABS64965.1 ribosomal protein S6 [Parvibaculum lavamentivorans DS-1]